MRQRTISLAVALTASAVGVVSGTAFGQAPRSAVCARDGLPSLAAANVAANGAGIAAAVGGKTVIVLGADGSRQASLISVGAATVRHVAARPGVGTAYVLDRRGPDAVVIQRPEGSIRLDQPGEVTHPAWSPDGKLVWSLGSGLRIWSPVGGSTVKVAAPADAIAVFSPVFTSANTVVAIVGEVERGSGRTEDEGLDNLWRYDLDTGRWTRLTSFRASGDRMLAIRTPLVRHDGSIEFIVARGLSSALRMPAWTLFEVTPGGATSRVRELPREMYLAGELDGHRVWNIYDQASGEWRLFEQTLSDRLVDRGCGAVAVDPRSVADPDLVPAADADEPPPTPLPTTTPVPTSTPVPTTTPIPTTSPTVSPDPADGHVAGILVGDFGSVEAANEAVVTIQDAFAGAAILEIVDSVTAPNIVRAGVWAVVMLLPGDADVLIALEDFRSRLPDYRDWSWVVSV